MVSSSPVLPSWKIEQGSEPKPSMWLESPMESLGHSSQMGQLKLYVIIGRVHTTENMRNFMNVVQLRQLALIIHRVKL